MPILAHADSAGTTMISPLTSKSTDRSVPPAPIVAHAVPNTTRLHFLTRSEPRYPSAPQLVHLN
jgi:hypothetical protein